MAYAHDVYLFIAIGVYLKAWLSTQPLWATLSASWVREGGVFLRECTIALGNFSNGFRPSGDPRGPTARENGMTRHKRATHPT